MLMFTCYLNVVYGYWHGAVIRYFNVYAAVILPYKCIFIDESNIW